MILIIISSFIKYYCPLEVHRGGTAAGTDVQPERQREYSQRDRGAMGAGG
jgi:hypothetical protein